MPRYRVLLLEPIHESGMRKLAEHAELVLADGLDEEALCRQVRGVHALVVRAGGRITRRVLEAADSLRVIGRHGVGLDNIDLEAARELGVAVVYTPLANAESVAEHAVGMMLALAKRLREGDAALRRGEWGARYSLTGRELLGKALGVVGMGRIGRRVAEICSLAFSMEVMFHDVVEPQLPPGLRAIRVDLEELLSRADFVSLHVPLLPSTYHMLGERELRLMPSTSCLVNTSRGGVVDQDALAKALREGWIAGAALDVFETEPLPPDSPLLELPNVLVTPHMASHTEESLRRMSEVVDDVLAVLEGRQPRFRAV